MGQSISDIVTAVDNNLFVDSSIKNGSFVRDDKGSLFRKVGGFAINFRLLQDDKMWAIRCWHIPIKESQDHYKKVCSFLEDANLSYLLPTKYIENGIIHLDGSVAPITKMQWIDGVTIKEYIVTHKNDKERLYQLADNFLNLCKSMHLNHIAHGDLQHGNILIDKKASVFLIDYDSFYAPNMGDKKRDEITGLKDYQHPARTKNKFANDKLDYFSELIIFLSVVAIAENPKLADIYKIATAEHLLFTSADFSDVRNSNIYKDVANLGDEFVQLLGILEEYLSENNILNLCPIESYLNNLNSTRFNAPLAYYIELTKARDEEAWTETVKSNTLEAFEKYLANFPKGRHRIAASNRRKKILDEQEQEREDKLWLEATTKNNIVFYAKYLRESVLKTHITEANVAIYTLQKQQAQDEEEKLWAKAVKSNTVALYQSYLSASTLKKYSKQASEAIERLNKQKQIETEENLWQYAVGRNTLEEYQKYLKYSHLKIYATEAESRIRAIDEANWALACKTSTIDAYNAYLKTFPKGLHVADAKRKIVSITNSKKIMRWSVLVILILGIIFVVYNYSESATWNSDSNYATTTDEGLKYYENTEYGYSIQYPSYLVRQGNSFASRGGRIKLNFITKIYDKTKPNNEILKDRERHHLSQKDRITYPVFRSNWCVLSGYKKGGSVIFYEKSFIVTRKNRYGKDVKLLVTAYSTIPTSVSEDEKKKGNALAEIIHNTLYVRKTGHLEVY